MPRYNLKRLIDGLHAAAFKAEGWRSILFEISAAVGGSGAILFSTDRRLPDPMASPDLDKALLDYGRDGWHLNDERYQGIPIMQRAGIVTDLDFMTPDQIRRSPFYQEMLAPHGLAWFAGLGFKAGGDLWCLALQRSEASGPFQPSELEAMKVLHRPFADAATLSRQFDETRLVGMADSLEAVQHAALVCDVRGRIIKMNAIAEDLIGPMIRPSDGTLSFTRPSCADAFARMMGEALRPHETPSVTPLAVDVQNHNGGYLTMRAIRIDGMSRFLSIDGAVLVLIKRRHVATSNLLAEIFKLTPAELRVAEAVCAGRSIREITTFHGVKEDTVRTQLKSIYAKTDTHRQSELVAFIGRISNQGTHFRGDL